MTARTYAPRDASASAPAPRTNGYAAACADCKGWVPAGAGTLTKEGGRWLTRHAGECPAPKPRTAASAQPELGYYVRADGAAIKVVKARNSERRYGVIFTPHPGRRPTWEYVKGAGYSVADLRPMSAEDAAALGLSHGHCIACCAPLGGETLSAAVSALIGYGETCAKNNGWAYPKGVAAQRAFLAERAK